MLAADPAGLGGPEDVDEPDDTAGSLGDPPLARAEGGNDDGEEDEVDGEGPRAEAPTMTSVFESCLVRAPPLPLSWAVQMRMHHECVLWPRPSQLKTCSHPTKHIMVPASWVSNLHGCCPIIECDAAGPTLQASMQHQSSTAVDWTLCIAGCCGTDAAASYQPPKPQVDLPSRNRVRLKLTLRIGHAPGNDEVDVQVCRVATSGATAQRNEGVGNAAAAAAAARKSLAQQHAAS
jgi:hypothetical protein